MATTERKALDSIGRFAMAVTRDTFPLGQTVVVEGFIDGSCGWEYDAPLHIMRPFHQYHIVTNSCPETFAEHIEDILQQVGCGTKLAPDCETWPYDAKYLNNLWARLRGGRARSGVFLFSAEVVVNRWADTDSEDDDGEWTITMQPTPTDGGLFVPIFERKPMRELTSHKVNGLNEVITIAVMDEPGAGGANHIYVVRTGDDEQTVQFQNGPIAEAGVNGISGEALLAIVEDRLKCFQAGQYACRENALALTHLQEAMYWLHHRTKERLQRGVEGTSAK